jgi:hypothetical protein
MKTITLQQLERDFDRIFDDVVENGEYYEITTTSLDEMGKLVENTVILLPYEDYSVLSETYDEWVDSSSEWVEEVEDQPIEEDAK